MDWVSIKQKAAAFCTQYRYVILVVCIGLALMAIPEKAETADTSEPTTVQSQSDPAQKLEEILGQIEGVGKVKVLLTVSAGEQTVYEYNESDSRREAVIITDSGRAEQGLVQQVIPPVYLGAVIVCQGGNKASVQLAVVEAVSNATGLSTDRITVLKMK